jgi:hypothetical protein
MTTRKLLFCLAALFLFVANAVWPQESAQQRPRKLIRLDAGPWQAEQWREILATDLDLIDFDAGQNSLAAIVTPAQLQELQKRSMRFVVLQDDLEEYQRQLRAQDYLDRFHNYQQTIDEIRLAEAMYPQLVKVDDIGDGWEKTAGRADRDIWAVKISDNAAVEEEEPEVLIIGQHHAREFITQEIVL